MSIEENKKVVLQFMQYMEQFDWARMADIMSENFQAIIPARSPTLAVVAKPRSKAEALHQFETHTATMPEGLRFTPLAMTAEGDRVAVEAESYALRSNGKVYNNLYHLLFVVRNGKVEVFKEYCDLLHAYETSPSVKEDIAAHS